MNSRNTAIAASSRSTGRFHFSHSSALMGLARLLCLSLAVAFAFCSKAQTWYYFTGNGANGNWSNPANWTVNGVPPGNSANVAVFMLPAANNKTSQVDIPGITLRQLVIQCTNHTFTSSVARTITLIGQGTNTPTVQMLLPTEAYQGTWTFQSNIELALNGACLFLCDKQGSVGNSSPGTTNRLTIAGRLSGSGSFRVAESDFWWPHFFHVFLQGSTSNTHTGGTVVGDSGYDDTTLWLDKVGTAIPGPLTIHSEVEWLRNHQVADTAAVTNGGFARLNAFNDTIGSLHLAGEHIVGGVYVGGFISTTTGLLTLAGDVTVGGGTENGIYGRLALGSPADTRTGRQFIVPGNGMVEVWASVSGSAILRKSGPGDMWLQWSNSYSGSTVVGEGKLWIGHSNALGSTSVSTFIATNATLVIDKAISCAEPLEIADHGTNNVVKSAVSVKGTTVQWTGPIWLLGNAKFEAYRADSGDGHLDLRGAIVGPGTLWTTSDDSSEVILSGTATNLHTGGTVLGGKVHLRRAGAERAVPGSLIVRGSVYAESPDQIAFTSDVTVTTGALWVQENQTIGSLSGGGGVVLASAHLTVGSNNRDTTYSGKIEPFGSPHSLIKVGSGSLTLTGTNIYSGDTTVQGGRLIMDGRNALSTVRILPGAALSGHGTVAQITGTGGSIMSGSGWAALNASSLALVAGHTYRPKINGTNAGIDADTLRVSGPVNLGGAGLSAVLTTGGQPGARYTLIDNTGAGAVVGTFAGLAQGALFTLGDIQFQISYTGGDGNDVVLTQLSNASPATLSGIDILPEGQFRVLGSGTRGFNYEVYGTITLVPPAWVHLGSVTASALNGSIQFVDPDAGMFPTRYYRFVQP